MIVKDMMTKNPIALRPDATLKKVLDTLAKNKISGCPVTDSKKRVIGVITQSDILKIIDVHSKIQTSDDLFSLVLAVIHSEKYDGLKDTLKGMLNMKIKDFMSKDVITIEHNEDLYKAARLMNSYDVDRLPVIQDDKLVGILTRWDIIRVLEKLECK